jgi:hypothetical protein
MRQGYSRAQQSKQDYSPPSPMRERLRSAVLACPSPYNAGETAEKSPPYEAWPEIEQVNRFYLLPTIGTIYQPYFNPFSFSAINNEPMTHQGLVDNLVCFMPYLKLYKFQLLPMILEHYQSHSALSGSCYFWRACGSNLPTIN